MTAILITAGIAIAIFIAIALFTNIGGSPADYAKKTNRQLLSTWRFHEANVTANRKAGPEKFKKAVEKMSTLTKEMKRRGLLDEDYTFDNEQLDSYSRTKFSRGLEEIKKFAKANDPEASYQLGMLFHSTKELTTAFQYLLRSANLNFPEAQFALGWAFLQGIGVTSNGNDVVPSNDKEALKWFKLAADQGHAEAKSAIHVAMQSISKINIDFAFEEAKQWTEARGLAANRVRIAAREAYERAFTLKQAEGRPESVCHTLALTHVLYSRLQASPAAPPASDEVTELILMECAPFRDLTPQEGMTAMVDYVVWREYPNLANENLISSAVRRMKPTLRPELVQVLKNAPFPWVRFL